MEGSGAKRSWKCGGEDWREEMRRGEDGIHSSVLLEERGENQGSMRAGLEVDGDWAGGH